jgi:hypothetical protein
MYPSIIKEVHKSVIKEILPREQFNITLSFCFSLAYILVKSALIVFLNISCAPLHKYCIDSLTPSYSTYQKGKSYLIIDATTNSLNFIGSNLEEIAYIPP